MLNKENLSLKNYIIELEAKYKNSNSLLDEEIKNKNINNNNIEKVMYSINYFIRKMYNLFPNMEKENNFGELKIDQYNELQQRLNIIENMINELFIQSIKTINYSLNEKAMTTAELSTIDHIKKEKKKQKNNTIYKKLKNKSVKKLKKRSNSVVNWHNNKSLNKKKIERIKKENN